MERAIASIRAQARMGCVVLALLSGCRAHNSLNAEVVSAERDASPGPLPLLPPSAPPASTSPDPFYREYRGAVISRIVVERNNVFEGDTEPTWLFGTANAIHFITREHVILRELLLQEGDHYDPSLAEESERILRTLDFLANARVYPVELGDGTVELKVITRDRFTLRGGASLGLFSGGSKTGVMLGESNFLGLGKDVAFRYEDENVQQYGLRYKDPQVFGSLHDLTLAAERTDEGDSYTFGFGYPFRSLATEQGYEVSARQREEHTRFYEDGRDIAQVPNRWRAVGGSIGHAFGERLRRRRIGLRAELSQHEFGSPLGDVSKVEVPGDTSVLELGPTFSIESLSGFAKETYLDALGFVEDVPLGFEADAFLGLHHRDEQGAGTRNEFAVKVRGRGATRPAEHHLLTVFLQGEARLFGQDVPGWMLRSGLHYYYQGLPYQTLAVSVAFDGVRETEGLTRQILLGEDSGLRGYRVRAFSGDRRLRINIEDRLFTDVELMTIRTGAVVFFDAGYAWNQSDGISTGDLRRSVGLGLRFGSPEILQRNVFRVDFAYPLDGDDRNPSLTVSASMGQIFDLFGNNDGLDRRF